LWTEKKRRRRITRSNHYPAFEDRGSGARNISNIFGMEQGINSGKIRKGKGRKIATNNGEGRKDGKVVWRSLRVSHISQFIVGEEEKSR